MIKAGAACVLAFVVAVGLSPPLCAGDPIDTPLIGGTFEYYGQLSPAYLTFDDGALKTDEFVDNSNSNSRIGMWYRRPFRWGRFNINFETALGFRGSNGISQNVALPDWNWTRSSIRKAEAIWETKRFGTFYFGQGSMASDGVATQDLSGTSIISYVGIPDTAGSFFLRTEAGYLSTVTVAAAFPNFDGGRRGRFRYDSPSFRGIVLSASIGEQILTSTVNTKDSDITLRYERDGPRFKITAAGGHTWIDRKTLANNRTAIGSVSVEHKTSGISFTMSSGTRDTTGNYRYFKLGYQAGISRAGPFSVSVDYYAANSMVSDGSRSESYGFGLVQRFSDPRIEAYLGLRNYNFTDTSTVRYQDAYSVLVGTRWKF